MTCATQQNRQGDLVLLLTRDGEAAALNAAHLGCPGPANVLSFPGDTPGAGELVLNLDALRRESRLYGQNMTDHARLLLAHGLAHLQGLEHGPEMDEICRHMLQSTVVTPNEEPV